MFILTLLVTAMVARAPKCATRTSSICWPTSGGRQATGYAGDPNVKTPNLDRLAQGRPELPQRGFGLPGLHALPRRADDRPLPDLHRHVPQRRLPARAARSASPRSSARPVTPRPTSASGISTATDAVLHPARAPAGLGLLEGRRVRPQLQPLALLHGRLEREAVLGRLRRVRPDQGCAAVPPRPRPERASRSS